MESSRQDGLLVQALTLIVLTLFFVAVAQFQREAGDRMVPGTLALNAPAPALEERSNELTAPRWSFPVRLLNHEPGKVEAVEEEVELPASFVLYVEPLIPTLPGIPTTAPLPGYHLTIPVEGVGMEKLVDTFAHPRSDNRRHLAIDIFAPVGTPVRAAAPGTVLRMHRSLLGGITAYVIDDDERYVYYYAHLSAYAEGLREGQRLHEGQKLGYVGYTGNADASQPHLHFAIWKQPTRGRGWSGRPVNPYLALKRFR